jgi:hypothetical protein
MENRERDRMSQRTTSTEAGELNRHVEEEKGRKRNSGTTAEFGQTIGRAENLEGGTMNNDRMNNDRKQQDNDISESSGSQYGTATGRSGSVGNMGGGGSDVDRNSRGKSTGEMGNTGTSGKSGSFGDPTQGRH